MNTIMRHAICCVLLSIFVVTLLVTCFAERKLGNQPFSKEVWNDPAMRHKCVDDLISSRRVVGLLPDEIKRILGEPNEIYLASEVQSPKKNDSEFWFYDMEFTADPSAFDSLQLVIVFDNTRHCREARLFRN